MTPVPDLLELSGLGGLYNGERRCVLAGSSASAGSSSLADFPVTGCRNFERLAGRAIRAELFGALAPQHVRWVYLGEGRLIIENLAGRDVWAGGRAIPDRVEVDIEKGPVEVEFGLGERIVAAFPGQDGPPQDLPPQTGHREHSAPDDPLAGTLTVHGEPPRPEDLDPPLRLYPGDSPEADQEPDKPRPEAEPSPAIPASVPDPADTRPERRGRRRPSSAAFFSILLHLVVILGLFSYIASGIVSAPGSLVTEVTVVTPPKLPPTTPLKPRETEPVPSRPVESDADLPPVVEDETPVDFDQGPGFDDAAHAGLPGAPGGGLGSAIGIGPGGVLGGGFGRGSGGGPSKRVPGVRAPLRAALDWLSRHQDKDGSWGGISSLKGCRSCTGAAKRDYRIAMTGLATLALTGAGHTHRDGEFKQTVRSAVKFLKESCDPTGSFHGESPPSQDRRMYGQAMAVLALAEVHRKTNSPFFKSALERGVRFIERAQEPYAGWRYQADRRSSDTSVTGWQVLALTAATRAGIRVNPATRSGARKWVHSMTETQTYRVGYDRRGRGSLAMTATGLAMRMFLGSPPSDPAIRGGVRILNSNRPLWPPTGSPPVEGNPADLYYWYFGTLASNRRRGQEWSLWRKAIRGALLAHQETMPDVAGSWPPPGKWEKLGGRVMSTALGALCLEVADGVKAAFK